MGDTNSNFKRQESVLKRQCITRWYSNCYLVFKGKDAFTEVLDGWDAWAS